MRGATRSLVIMLTTFLAAAAALAQPAAAPPTTPLEKLAVPPQVTWKLDNGLQVVLIHDPTVPKVTLLLTFLAGAGSDATLHPGIAQLAARVMKEGTATRSSREIREELRSIGGELTVTTDTDATTLTASALSEFAPRLVALVADVARNAAYPKSEVELAKQNLIAEIDEERSTPDFLANERLQKALYGNHPYSFVVAEPAAIAKLTQEQLRAFDAAHYAPNNAHLIVVGDVDEQAMKSELRKAFGDWAKVTMPPAATPATSKRDRRHIDFIDRPGSVQSSIYIGALAAPRKSPDYLAVRTANMILGGAFYSRLTRNIREQKGYTYSPFSEADLRRTAGAFYMAASVRNEVTGPTILEMLYELDRMRIAPVTDEELASAKTFSIGNMAIELATQSGLASRVDTVYTYDLPHDFLEQFAPRVAALTPLDIRKAAAKYFDTYRSAVVIVGDWNVVQDQVTPFGEVTLYDANGKKK